MKVKVRVLRPIFEGKNYYPGDVFETTKERAKQLGGAVEIIEEEKKEKEYKPENKMVKEKRVKKK